MTERDSDATSGAIQARVALCFIASDGYLFQTFVSALQARAHMTPAYPVFVIHLGAGESDEYRAFLTVAQSTDITLVHKPPPRGLHPTYARLFLDEFVPEMDEFLYLDGDTQVVGNLAPLLEHNVAGVAGVRDPMVLIREASPRFRRRIDGWWTESAIPERIRVNYSNGGMLRASAASISALRTDGLSLMQRRHKPYRFHDQDLINLAAGDDLEVLSPRWNFPGFFLGTKIEKTVSPVVLHFMSNPRPWEAPYVPWGNKYYEPYQQFANLFPHVSRYWAKASFRDRARYNIQQAVKLLTERPRWQKASAEAVARWSAGQSLR